MLSFRVKKTTFASGHGYIMINILLPRRVFRFSVRTDQNILLSSTLSSKYGYFWLQKNQDGDGRNAKLEATKW